MNTESEAMKEEDDEIYFVGGREAAAGVAAWKSLRACVTERGVIRLLRRFQNEETKETMTTWWSGTL